MVVLYISCAVDPKSNTPPDSYSAASHFGGVTDWYQSRGYREPDTIMSDFEDSTVTHTTVSSPCEGRSGDVSPGVDGPPVIPEDPYAYVVAAFQALPPSDYVHGSEEPEQAPPSPPLPAAASPTADSPGYIPEFDPKDDDEEEEEPFGDDADEEDEEQDEDDDDEEEEEPFGDDADEEDEEQDEDDDDEEEEHPTLADSILPPPALRAGESSVADAARPIEGRRPDYGFVDSVEAEIRRRRARISGLLSSLQGRLATALGEIQALQAREQARAGAPEGAGSST
nr:hypothetical protein [Tanacetum cinerariifolium]